LVGSRYEIPLTPFSKGGSGESPPTFCEEIGTYRTLEIGDRSCSSACIGSLEIFPFATLRLCVRTSFPLSGGFRLLVAMIRGLEICVNPRESVVAKFLYDEIAASPLDKARGFSQ